MISIEIGEEYSLTIRANGQYQLVSDFGDGDWPAPDGLTTGGEGWISVITATRLGPIKLDVGFLAKEPIAREDFEMVVERDIEIDNRSLELLELDGPKVARFQIGNGSYRARVSARNRSAASHTYRNEESVEEHLLQIWEVPEPRGSVTLVGPDAYGQSYLK